MLVIPPLAITDARLTSSTVAEPGVGAVIYNPGSTYGVRDEVVKGSPGSTVTISIASPGVVTSAGNGLPDATPVIFTSTGKLPTGIVPGEIYYIVHRSDDAYQIAATIDGAPIVTTGSQSGAHTATAHLHRRYESLVTGNRGNEPAIDDGTKWLEIGPSNRWAPFDLGRNTTATDNSPMTYVITPGVRINSIGIIGIVGNTLRVLVTSVKGGGVVYDATTSLSGRLVQNWFDYFFLPFSPRKAVAHFDIPPNFDNVITVTVARGEGQCSISAIVVGLAVYIGKTQFNAESDALNFSTVTRDAFGNTTLVKRRAIPKTDQAVRVQKSNITKVIEVRTLLNAEVALWSGLDDDVNDYFEALLILGFYKRFSLNIDQPSHALANITLEEV